MKKVFTLIALAVLCATTAFAETWTIVGSKAIMNGTKDWAVAETANDLSSEDDVNYTLTVTDKTLEAGTTYEYKFAKDHAWGGDFPSTNAQLTVEETAVYTIVYTVNVNTQEYTATPTKTGEAGVITHIYSIAGEPSGFFGGNWDEKNTATEMTLGADDVYSWTSKDATLAAGDVKFKVVVDHGWGESYPSTDNYIITIDVAGTYDVTITFNASTKDVAAKATLLKATAINDVAGEVKNAGARKTTKGIIVGDKMYNYAGQLIK